LLGPLQCQIEETKKNPASRGFSLTAKNYFLGASAGAGAAGAAAGAAAAGAAAASAGFASAAGAAGAAAAAAGAGAGAAAGSFLPQAAKAAAAITAAKTRDLFMIIFLKVSEKTISGKLSSGLETRLTEQQALEFLLFSLEI
jgi:hypothetical protein